MTQRPISPRLAVAATAACLAVLLAVVGCSRKPTSEPVREVEKPTPPAEAKPFADWPDDLAGALMISGEMVGYLEPCGCTRGQRGGLTRRMVLADLLRKERKWPLAAIDLGSLINDPNGSRGGGIEETKIRFATALKALTLLGYNGVSVSADDLKVGVGEALMLYSNTLADGADAPRVLAANVVPDAGLRLEKKFRTSVRTQVGPIRLGVTSVLDPEALARLRDDSKDQLLAIQPPDKALPSVLADLEKDTDVQVLMVQGPAALAKSLAEANPGFDLVISTSEFVDPPDKPEMLHGGKTWLVGVGRKGQYVGVVGFPRDPKAPRLYRRVALGEGFDAGPNEARGQAVKKLIDEDFVADLKSAEIVPNFTRKRYSFADIPPSDARYVGAATCRECHPNTFAKWDGTRHGHAYESLVKRKREPDAECVRCHTTGFEYEGGFGDRATVADLRGNQCENCHGPGSKHAGAPDDKVIRKTIARSADDFERQHRCLQCHDEDNAPHGFDFKTMWAKVMHNKLDRYDDPKVHKGIAAKQAAIK